MTPDTQRRLDDAATHLHAAAAIARRHATDRSHHLAGLIELTADGIAPDRLVVDEQPPGSTVTGALLSALTALDSIDPADGPPDLLAWSAAVADLLRIAARDEATRP